MAAPSGPSQVGYSRLAHLICRFCVNPRSDAFETRASHAPQGEGGSLSRRDLIKASVAAAAFAAAPARVRAAAPEPVPVTPALIEAAKKEGKVVWYAAMDLPVSERVARGFEAKYPGIAVRIERTGSERQFQRLAQEYAANIFVPDVINASDAAHFIAWKRNQWLAAFVPEEVARFYPAEHRDPDGLYATSRVYVSSLGYNTNMVKARTRPSRSSICSSRNGRARSSRRTRPTAARS